MNSIELPFYTMQVVAWSVYPLVLGEAVTVDFLGGYLGIGGIE